VSDSATKYLYLKKFQKKLFGFLLIACMLLIAGCQEVQKSTSNSVNTREPFIVVLGIAQDAGYPQIGCEKSCCSEAFRDQGKRKHITCLGLVDPVSEESWLFEATPDIKDQLHALNTITGGFSALPNGIFLTHAHIGHYTGLMELGREAMGAKGQVVYTMPRMKSFLTKNGPWSQLVSIDNIQLLDLKADSTIMLNERLSVTPFLVPHRDEYSETVGFRIAGPEKQAIFIPDIDKWSRWETDIVQTVRSVDYAFLDGSFYHPDELPGRNMSEIPHPFVPETMDLFENERQDITQRVHFIHFNHTNAMLRDHEPAKEHVLRAGFNIAMEGSFYPL
jgi:pyrroloquinoline quinone biosynthesis protein B